MKECHNILYAVYTFFTTNSPNYFNEVNVFMETNGVRKRSSYFLLLVEKQMLDRRPRLKPVPHFGVI